MTTLRFVDRPYTSPCVLCPAAIPLDQTVSLENADGNTVCDQCAKAIDPAAARALEVLRGIDTGVWEIAGPLDEQAVTDARAYLRHVMAGVQVLAEFYGATTVEEATP